MTALDDDSTDSEGKPSTYKGPVFSETIGHRDPNAVAGQLESTLVSLGFAYRKASPLLFHLQDKDRLKLTAEVCKLAGFRSVYVISFRRLQGDGWEYSRFVSSILEAFKPP
jgi:maternal embryonic leucine zipper kinase